MKIIEDLIGKPFTNGGRGPATYDCWGLCMAAFRRFGYQLPEYPIDATDYQLIDKQIKQDRPEWNELKTPEAPCIVLMRLGSSNLINHCGVYLGNGHLLHTRQKTGSVLDRLENPVIKAITKGFVFPPEAFKL